MIPFLSASHLVSAIAGETSQPETLNEDFAFHLRSIALRPRDPLALRLLPRMLRLPLKAHLAARRKEKSMIALWEASPHLLRDAGIVLTRGADLPPHLVGAPERVIAHVAARDPEQIMRAELEFPARADMPVQPEPVQRANPVMLRLRLFS